MIVTVTPPGKARRRDACAVPIGGSARGGGTGLKNATSSGAAGDSPAPMSTVGASPVRPARMRTFPKASVVTEPMRALEPASIVGLAAVSWASPPGALASAGAAQMLPTPAKGALVLPTAHRSLNVAVTFSPSVTPKPPRSLDPELPATIVFSSTAVSLVSPSRPAAAPAPVAVLPEMVALTSVRW